MATRQDIVNEARTWIDTPWRHQGRVKGIGCDCVGIVVMVPVALGLKPPDFNITGYSRSPDPTIMINILNEHMDRVANAGDRQHGDVLLLIPKKIPQHTAIYATDRGYPTIIHAIDTERGVREHRLDDRWTQAISGCWQFRGLDD